MRKAVINPENCKACTVCMQNCAKGVGCGICYIVCPDAVFTIVSE